MSIEWNSGLGKMTALRERLFAQNKFLHWNSSLGTWSTERTDGDNPIPQPPARKYSDGVRHIDQPFSGSRCAAPLSLKVWTPFFAISGAFSNQFWELGADCLGNPSEVEGSCCMFSCDESGPTCEWQSSIGNNSETNN